MDTFVIDFLAVWAAALTFSLAVIAAALALAGKRYQQLLDRMLKAERRLRELEKPRANRANYAARRSSTTRSHREEVPNVRA